MISLHNLCATELEPHDIKTQRPSLWKFGLFSPVQQFRVRNASGAAGGWNFVVGARILMIKNIQILCHTLLQWWNVKICLGDAVKKEKREGVGFQNFRKVTLIIFRPCFDSWLASFSSVYTGFSLFVCVGFDLMLIGSILCAFGTFAITKNEKKKECTHKG